MAQDEENQSKHGTDSVTVEVSDLQQQSGVFLARLAAPLDDRCLALSAFSQCTVNSMLLCLHHAASQCTSTAHCLEPTVHLVHHLTIHVSISLPCSVATYEIVFAVGLKTASARCGLLA